MNIDSTHSFSSTLKRHNLKNEERGSNEERWILGIQQRKGIVIDEILRIVKNKNRSRDFFIGQLFESLLNS